MKNVIVIGGGDVGAYLGRSFTERGDNVVLIEQNPVIARQIDEELNVQVKCASGASAEVLHECRVENCDFFLALTQNDHVNLIACSIAKRMGAKLTVARIHDNTYSDYSYLNYQLQFGIDLLVNPESLAANEIAKSLRSSGRVAVENFGHGEIEVQQMGVSPHSSCIGKTLKEIKLGDGLRIAYMSQNGEVILPSRETRIEPYAQVTLVGHPSKIFEARKMFKADTSLGHVLNVAICGANEASVALIKQLSSGNFRIKLFEPDELVCEQLADRFPNITVVNGKGTSLRLLEEESVGECDHFIAATKSDEENIMSCLQARKLGARHLHLILNRVDYEGVVQDLRQDLHLHTIAAPRIVTAEELMRFTSDESVIELASLPDQVATFFEVRIEENSAGHNKLISEIALPQGCVIIALLHKFQVKVPAAHDRILAGDRLILIAHPSQRAAFEKALL